MTNHVDTVSTQTRYRLLEERASDALGHLVRLAGAAFGAPVAFLALLDERGHLFETVVGTEGRVAEGYLPLCHFTLLQPVPFAIADVRSHEMLGGEAIAHEPNGPRRIVGALLRRGGRKAGVLLLLDPQPGEPEALAMRLLPELVAELEAQLQANHDRDRLKASHSQQVERLSYLEGVFRAVAGLAIVAFDGAGTVRAFNEGAEALFGVSARQVLGLRNVRLLSPTDGAGEARFTGLLASVQGGAVERYEQALKREDGSRFPAHCTLSAHRDEDGTVQGFVLVVEDLSERRRLEELKDEFVANVSHELRTPLTSIRGALGLVVGGGLGPLSGEVREVLQLAQANGDRLGRLVDDLLDASSALGGSLSVDRAPLDLVKLVGRAVELMGAYAAPLGVRLEWSAPPPAAWVVGDEARLEQVVMNLLSNAAKFSPSGSAVRVQLTQREGAWTISVTDEGPGVPEDFRPHLFRRFMQAAPSLHGRRGTGLGLHIVRNIVEAHGGEVGHRPGELRGSTFFVSIPAHVPPSPPSAPAAGQG